MNTYVKVLLFLFLFCGLSCSNHNTVFKKKDVSYKVNQFMSSANKAQQKGDRKTAINLCHEALSLKEDANIRAFLGSAYLLSCDYENAIKNFRLAVKNKKKIRKEEYIICMLGIGNALMMLEKYQDSFDVYYKLYKEIDISKLQKEEKIYLLSGIAKAEWRIKKYDEALRDFQAAIDVEDRGYLHIGMSRVKVAMGDFQRAYEDCLYAVSVEDSSRTRVGLAEAKAALGDIAGSLQEYKTALTKQSFCKTKEEREKELQHIKNCIKRTENELNEIRNKD